MTSECPFFWVSIIWEPRTNDATTIRCRRRGVVNALKMSPNLRLRVKPPKKQLNADQTMLQNLKLEKLLSLVRELPE